MQTLSDVFPMKTRQRKPSHVYFKLWLEIKEELDSYIKKRPTGGFGIGVASDHYAKKYQAKKMRFELLDAYMKGNNPDWWYANYLSKEERALRNRSYEL